MKKKEQVSPLRDILLNTVIGAGDGLIVPAAVIAVLTASGATLHTITNWLIAVISFAALVMGLGGYFTRKNADLQPKNFVKDELQGADREKTREFFANLGMNEDMQQLALDEMAKDDEEWSNFVDRYDMDPSVLSAAGSGVVIGIAYAAAALLALLPFFFQADTRSAFYTSVAITLPLLFILGMLKALLTGQSVFAAGFRLFVMGVLAIALSFFAAQFFVSR